jgi:opacity protein-like surface antigen
MKLILLTACLLASSAFTAQAADLLTPAEDAPTVSSGAFYLFGAAGGVLPNDIEATQSGVDPDEVNAVIGLKEGYTASGGVGYRLGNGLRFEGELGYINVGTVDLTLPDYSPDAISDDAPGSVSGFYGMASVWMSLPTGSIRPFVGGGLGLASLTVDVGPYFGDKSIDDTATALAWQVGAGVEADIGSDMELFARYRYFGTQDFTMTDVDSTEITGTFHANIVDVGLRVSF